MKRKGGFRRKTRYKLRKSLRERGKISLSRFFQSFKEGDQVQLVSEPAVQKGMYYPRFYGRSGVVTGKQGRCYQVAFKDQNKDKVVIVHPVHLKKL